MAGILTMKQRTDGKFDNVGEFYPGYTYRCYAVVGTPHVDIKHGEFLKATFKRSDGVTTLEFDLSSFSTGVYTHSMNEEEFQEFSDFVNMVKFINSQHSYGSVIKKMLDPSA